MTKKFQVSTEVVSGVGALDRLCQVAHKRVLVVCDAFILQSGMVDRVVAKLDHCETEVFSEVVPDPPLDLIARGLEVLRRQRPEVVLAVGGGSVIDAAKAMCEFAREAQVLDGALEDFIALPTTSGTGSEVTRYAVVTDPDRGVKVPLVSDRLLPTVALLDPELTTSVPPQITADTGMDVITHALEALVSRGADDFSDALAEKALALAFEFLPRAFADGAELSAREKMHMASCLAGIAFDRAGLGINHSLAHAIGGRYHVPHGRANAILLPYTVEYNADIQGFSQAEHPPAACCYQRVARLLGLPAATAPVGVSNLLRSLRKLREQLGIPDRLRDAGIDPAALAESRPALAQTALADVCTQSNPRSVDEAALEAILTAAA